MAGVDVQIMRLKFFVALWWCFVNWHQNDCHCLCVNTVNACKSFLVLAGTFCLYEDPQTWLRSWPEKPLLPSDKTTLSGVEVVCPDRTSIFTQIIYVVQFLSFDLWSGKGQTTNHTTANSFISLITMGW